MRRVFPTRPCLLVRLISHTYLYIVVVGVITQKIVNFTLEAVVSEIIAWTNGQLVIFEWAICYAQVCACSVATKPGNGIKDDRFTKVARFESFRPVSKRIRMITDLGKFDDKTYGW